jgi:hypothetical protein
MLRGIFYAPSKKRMRPRSAGQLVIALIPLCVLFSGCDKESASFSSENLTTRDCRAEKLRHAIDAFRLQPDDETRELVNRELAALDRRIDALEDKAELAEGKAQAQLRFDAKALRSVRAYNVERFEAPVERNETAGIAKAEKAERLDRAANPVPEIAVRATPMNPPPQGSTGANQIEIRRAVAVSDNQAADEGVEIRRASPVVQADVSVPKMEPTSTPVRRAIAVDKSSTVAADRGPARIVFQSADGRHLTIWQREPQFRPELAGR